MHTKLLELVQVFEWSEEGQDRG